MSTLFGGKPRFYSVLTSAQVSDYLLGKNNTFTGVNSFINTASQVKFGTANDQGNLYANTTGARVVWGAKWTGTAYEATQTSAELLYLGSVGMQLLRASGLTVGGAVTWTTDGAWTGTGLGIGTTSPGLKLDVAGGARVTSNNTPATGSGLEFQDYGAYSRILGYDRGGSAYKEVRIDGAPLLLNNSASGGVKIGANGTPVSQVTAYAPSLTPAAVAANTTAEQIFTVTGLATTDKVIVNGPAPAAGTGIVSARVSAANTLALTFVNATAAGVTPTAGTYNVIATRT